MKMLTHTRSGWRAGQAAQRVALRRALRRSLAAWLAPLLLLGLVACGSAPVAPPPVTTIDPAPDKDAFLGARGTVAGRSDKLLVYLPAEGDTLPAIAARFLGKADRAWQIADANFRSDNPARGEAGSSGNAGGSPGTVAWQIQAGTPLVVPLAAGKALGVDADSYQSVPILCYHRFGSGPSKMIVSPSQFEAQLAWLARNNFRVLRLSELAGFLAAREALPQRSVVITIDDGYESVHRHAFPLLKKYGVPATLFMYTDFVGAGDGLSWAQLQELAASGLVDIQAHSKTHRNLIEKGTAESDTSYRQNIDNELRAPRQALEKRLAVLGVKVRHFAYPFGDANDLVLEGMKRHQYDLGVTVNPGGNPFFSHPLMLRRTMIFGDHDLEDFKSRLQIRKPMARP
jgi:peptidoglycan/xylan/chitin deacetylase (PgdA/CDA1 family)